MNGNEWMFYGGIALMAAAAVGAAVAAVVFRRAKRRLAARLNAEFGEKRH